MVKTNTEILIPKFHTYYKKPKYQGLVFPEQSLTEQHHANDVDINEIVQKYTLKEFRENHLAKDTPQNYGEFINFDYADSMNKLSQIQTDFANLPSKERLQYDNDPMQWYQEQIEVMVTEATKVEPEIVPTVVETVPELPKAEAKAEEKTPTAVGGA